ncbi:Nucleotidyltransferase [Fomitopsis serialis]|uniref:Nucleotidyltransferase n=1 Tax=Fomitopsis serialis TaxID=139415 RepID=UPI0020089D77|nr:Nucleotidyltransferase [Neoantrodia serialis]KAH9915905.1 Nucleotidyltransferase [Neoantrodia serialis]
MPFKRPAPEPHPRSDSQSLESSSSALQPSKHARLEPSEKAIPDVTLYIVQAKLDPSSLSELFRLAERHAQRLCSNATEADVIITTIRMRRRLERHIPWTLAKQKAIVTPQWLRDCVKQNKVLPCVDYAAIQELRTETEKNCPECNLAPCLCGDSDSEVETPSNQPASSKHRPTKAGLEETQESDMHAKIPARLLHPDPSIPTPLDKLNYASRYACRRASPLTCPNQELVRELDIVHRSRAMESEERNALSYQRAISVIKAYPHRITSVSQVQKLPFIGQKTGTMVEEFIDTGKIEEAQTILASDRFKALSLFTSVYGIGPNTAHRLYSLGLRSINDLEIYYGVERDEPQATGPSELQEVEMQKRPHYWRGQDQDKGNRKHGLGDSWIRIALELREDLAIKIPRAEVEEMERIVMAELAELEPGCVSTIVGGYRRGKPESNDVDIVFTHPDAGVMKGLCKRFVRRLYERGMVSHVMHLSGFHGHNPLRTTHWDSLEKALTVFTLPNSSQIHNGIRRRLDMIFAPPEVYWTAVIGWSGSIMFQRDLRQWAKDKLAMKFDSSGITRRYDSKMFFPKTEKEAFDLLGLEWVAPEWRNADA